MGPAIGSSVRWFCQPVCWFCRAGLVLLACVGSVQHGAIIVLAWLFLYPCCILAHKQ